jgi:hypothetical protein
MPQKKPEKPEKKTKTKAPTKGSGGERTTTDRTKSRQRERRTTGKVDPPATGAGVGRGDRIVIDSAQVGSPAREGEILRVMTGGLSVSYQVRWADGHESVISPAAGAARIIRPGRSR